MGAVMSNWYRWKSLAEFQQWHNAAKAALGIPRPGKGLSSNRERTANQWTLAYTEAYIVAKDDVRAIVEADALHVPGLGEPCDCPVLPSGDESPVADKEGDDADEPVWQLKAEAIARLQLADEQVKLSKLGGHDDVLKEDR